MVFGKICLPDCRIDVLQQLTPGWPSQIEIHGSRPERPDRLDDVTERHAADHIVFEDQHSLVPNDSEIVQDLAAPRRIARNDVEPANRGGNLGFRVARTYI